MILVPLLILAFFVSLFGTRWYFSKPEDKLILDIPNERSSHSTPTPRGGGVVFAAVFLVSMAFFYILLPENRELWSALLGSGTIVALTGWIDDRRHLSPKVRLLAQSVAAVWALYCLGGMPEIILTKNITVKLGILGTILAFIGGVWLINLYNFMDGIDGLAGGQGVFVSLAGAWFFLQNGQATIATSLALLALSLAGFLRWNWPPAKVFMGDVGSGFLGIVFFVYALEGEHTGSAPALVWAVLLAPFVIDATLTLLRRMKRKEKLFQAHRSHVYQLAVQKGHSHQVVSLSFLVLDVALLVFLVVTGRAMKNPVIPFITVFFVLILLWGMLDKRWKHILDDKTTQKAGK